MRDCDMMHAVICAYNSTGNLLRAKISQSLEMSPQSIDKISKLVSRVPRLGFDVIIHVREVLKIRRGVRFDEIVLMTQVVNDFTQVRVTPTRVYI